MISVRVADGATVFEPSTTGSATTEFAGFLDGSAFGAYGSNSRRRHCRCANTGQMKKETISKLDIFRSKPREN